ncbi:MAG: DUF5343 domain-containing protein [Planctomycetaceae bacterium]
MAKKQLKKSATTAEPKFPYTPAANSLRKFLKDMPNKPKPPKVTAELLKSWGLTSSNDRNVIGILKKLDFLDPSGVPTQNYEAFMHKGTGPATMGAQLKRVYSPLFQASHRPHEDRQEDLKRLFNIHSGGSEGTINFQIQTFKTLCEFASFDQPGLGTQPITNGQATAATVGHATISASVGTGVPTIHIDLHIHLPENKTTRDYEAIIQDIARYIYKQEMGGNGQ